MATTLPQQATVARELVRDLWQDNLKKWIDFRDYLRQRHVLLRNPELIFNPPADWKNWKSPKQFAVVGLVSTSLFVALIALTFSIFYKEPTKTSLTDELNHRLRFLKYMNLSSHLATNRQQLEEELAKDNLKFNEPDLITALNRYWPGGRSLEEAVEIANADVDSLTRQIRVESYEKRSADWLETIMPACVLVLAAYLFRFFAKLGMGRDVPRIGDAHEVYLYLVTGSLFTVNLITTICVAVLTNAITYHAAWAAQAAQLFIFAYAALFLWNVVVTINIVSQFRLLQYPITFAQAIMFTGLAEIGSLILVVIAMTIIQALCSGILEFLAPHLPAI